MRPRRAPGDNGAPPHTVIVSALPALRRAFLLLLAAATPLAALAARETVCTITVNSSDEREAFRRNLPADRFDFVELVEHGRPDWLRSACERKVSCDVLVVSGHFAGTEFYSSKPEVNETLRVDELERASCGGSCPDLFAHLKEVYLFGCDSLKAEPVVSAMPEIVRGLIHEGRSAADAERLARELSRGEAEDARDRMRRVFSGVPVIYGFSSLAPYGRTAGPLLERYFDSAPAGEVGSGRPSERLLALFGPSSMIATRGMSEGEADWHSRGKACRFYGDRTPVAEKVDGVHRELEGDMPHVRMAFDRVERFVAGLSAAQREDSAVAAALARLAADAPLQARYLAIERATDDPVLRVRMIDFGRTAGWLGDGERHAELARAIGETIARPSVGFGDVDLVCTLNADRGFDGVPALAKAGAARTASQAAALACLGDMPALLRVLRLLASADAAEVQLAQAYLRHRPVTDAAELRAMAREIAAMPAGAAQVRALDALGRMHPADSETLDTLAALFGRTRSLAVQRAVAEVFLRSDPAAIPAARVAKVLRTRRLRSPDGQDLIDVLVRQLS
jgi:hypothetical protein